MFYSRILIILVFFNFACGPTPNSSEDEIEQLNNKPVISTQPYDSRRINLRQPTQKPATTAAPKAAPSKAPSTAPGANPAVACSKISLPQSPLQSAAQLKQRFLDSHNKIRRQFGVPDLVWDNNLAAYAQRWANHLRDRKQCKMEHRSSAGITEGKRYGENLAWNWTSRVQQSFDKSPEFAVENWSKECKDYNFQSNKCSGVCGHFTQVIWKKSQRVGCAVATCNQGGHSEIWVCNYDPPGNYINESPL